MKDEKLKQLFKLADLELNRAKEELFHPAEDVVNYVVCVNARSALYLFLTCLYEINARENNEPAEKLHTLEQLVEKIGKYTRDLESVDLSGMNCRNRKMVDKEDEVYFCNDVDKVKYCTSAAERVRELVILKAWDF
ncbi:MAG: hypothetical protein WEA56_13055 [Balneolaceae bacterium]